jgi:phosphatidylglycerol lysyltransferase
MNPMMKKVVQNFAIFLLVMIGIKNIIATLPAKYFDEFRPSYSNLINPYYVSTHHMLSFLFGLLILLLAYRAYRRVRLAWILELALLIATIILQFQHYHRFTILIIVVELFTLTVLVLSQKDFCRRPDKLTIKKVVLFVLASFVLVIGNAAVGIFMMKQHIANVHDMLDAIENSAKLLIFMDKSVLEISGQIGQAYADSLIMINWILIFLSVSLLLKPLVYDPIEIAHDKGRVRELVMKYGQNPVAYLSLEDDKKYFLGNSVNGVCAYQVVTNVFVVCGDMICDEKDGFAFLNEILHFCRQNAYDVMFINVTDRFCELYKMAGFGILKCGEDACFKLSDYKLEGGKVAKVRAAINHAMKAGISVIEYKPVENKDRSVERQIAEITSEWLRSKGGEEMGFMLGGASLGSPMDRRYFYAIDAEGVILGFVVFLPYLSGKGYMADVTRRRSNAPQGVIESIVYSAFMKMKEEGVEWGNMGLSPLYNVAEADRATFSEKLFNYIYENMNSSYDFKSLHHAKEKFAPTEWQPRYLAFSPRPFSPSFAYAMVKVQAGKQLARMVISEFGKKKGEKNA